MTELIKDFYCQAGNAVHRVHRVSDSNEDDKEPASWIAYYNEPVGSYMYLCTDCLVDTIIENSSSFKNRLISVRFLFDALNQIGGSGILSSLPSRT